MKHFFVFLILVFGGLIAAILFRQNQDPTRDARPVLRIYAPSSFLKAWGPGPWLKEKFETSCECRVEYHDGQDAAALVERVKSEPKSRAADLVLGFNQYDLEIAHKGMEWKAIKVDSQNFDDTVRPLLSRTSFIPYDWGVLTFLAHKAEVPVLPKTLDDLLNPDYAGAISLQDPRTSSPGLQFLLWLIQIKGEEEGFQFLKKFAPQVKVWGANWSTSYGLFQKHQAKITFSYAASVVAGIQEDPLSDIVALPFAEGHPLQYEFLGIPSTCQNCDLAEKFVGLVLSREGQKVVMEKNFMFPVIHQVMQDSPFDKLPQFTTIDMTVIPNLAERERILKKWSQLRRAE